MSAGASPSRAMGHSPAAEHWLREQRIGRSALNELLHALNQPLTGLQCSLEVTLAAARTSEHYRKTLRDGLALTERMRLLVEGLREVAESIEERSAAGGGKPGREMDAAGLRAEAWGSWREAICDAVEELAPVAEMKQLTMALNLPQESVCPSRGRSQRMRSACEQGIFRMLDAIVGLAASGSVMHVKAEPANEGGWFRVQWQRRAGAEGEKDQGALSRPELGLLVARARMEQFGAEWRRQRTADGEVVSVQLPTGLSGQRGVENHRK